MIVSNADIWRDYREINEDLELTGDRALSNDSNIEDPALSRSTLAVRDPHR